MPIMTETKVFTPTKSQKILASVFNRIDQLNIVERHVSRGASLVPTADGQRYVITYPDGRSVAVVSRRYIPCMHS